MFSDKNNYFYALCGCTILQRNAIKMVLIHTMIPNPVVSLLQNQNPGWF